MDADERLAAFYEQRAAEEPASDPEALLRFDKAIAAAALHPGERALDVGAKWGGLASRLPDGVAYTGLDLSEENVQRATAAGLEMRLADVTKRLPVDDAAYDCVFCLELLEHLTAPLALLEELRRVLSDDGRAVVSVPSPYSWVEVYRELFGRHDPEGHLNAFTTPVLANLAGLAGFRVERRLGTSIRIPRTMRLVPTDSILARSRIYVIRPTDRVVFAGREL
ncbi:MAG TPA: class I SAM-dependent methyltransferase [Gaiellaceae bacterium]|nr:class I SAM-dependent methyltransferase [Gaiellaceae bacterium]